MVKSARLRVPLGDQHKRKMTHMPDDKSLHAVKNSRNHGIHVYMAMKWCYKCDESHGSREDSQQKHRLTIIRGTMRNAASFRYPLHCQRSGSACSSGFGHLRKKLDFLSAGVRHPHHNKVFAKGGK